MKLLDSIPGIGSEGLNGFAAGLKQTNLYPWLRGCSMNYASVAFVTSEVRQNWRERLPDTNGLENWIWWPEVTMQKIFCLVGTVL